MPTHARLLALALAFSFSPIAGGALAEDKAPARVIAAVDAMDHLDQDCTVEMTVKLSKNVPDKVCYLDSETDFKAHKNVAVLIVAKDLEAFQKAGVDDPATFYKGKVIRVTGKVIFESGQVRIHVTDPKQIAVVDKKD